MDPVVTAVARQLRTLFPLEGLYLFNVKRDLDGAITAFKLCAVVAGGDKQVLERRVYRSVDCEIPFDILFYTVTEWRAMLADANSFASRIQRLGREIIG